MKLQKTKTNYSIGIPKSIVEGLGWKKQDDIQVRIAGKNRLELVKE